jgi:hypothetical protein
MRNTFITLFVLAMPRAALACPVCFGQNDSPMAKAANLSIVAMLVVVAGVLAGFASFFIHLMRRARLATDEASGPADSLRQGSGRHVLSGPVEAGRYVLSGPAEAGRRALQGSNPQEGTAQC